MKVQFGDVVLLLACLCTCGYSIAPIPTPTVQQIEWSKMEIGAMISFGMETSASNLSDIGLCTGDTGGWLPPVDWFNPLFVDTDQWARAMVAFGAKYAVFTAKHCSGFTLWPTKVPGYTYSIQYNSWMNGTQDLVSRFINSCRKYGIKPGLYYSIGENYYLNILQGALLNGTVPGQRVVTLDQYSDIVMGHLTELWTQYGALTEIWFDGGTYSFSADIEVLLQKTQPLAIAFQGPKPFANVVRWIGNENADPPYPCWSTALDAFTYGGGEVPENGPVVWAPGESDTPIRNEGKWFWTDNYYQVGVKSVGELMQEYEASVGRNTNFLLNLSPDPYGVVPVADMYAYEQLGAAITKCYAKSINETSSHGRNVTQLKLNLAQPLKVNRIVISEDQSKGQLVRSYQLFYSLVDTPPAYKFLSNGTSVGNKRIEVLPSDITAQYFLLDIVGLSGSAPIISKFAAHFCDRLY